LVIAVKCNKSDAENQKPNPLYLKGYSFRGNEEPLEVKGKDNHNRLANAPY
jgi:hypothetical protein